MYVCMYVLHNNEMRNPRYARLLLHCLIKEACACVYFVPCLLLLLVVVVVVVMVVGGWTPDLTARWDSLSMRLYTICGEFDRAPNKGGGWWVRVNLLKIDIAMKTFY